jgi:hypothetical protein
MAMVLVGRGFIVAAGLYGHLPDPVPTHWRNASIGLDNDRPLCILVAAEGLRPECESH